MDQLDCSRAKRVAFLGTEGTVSSTIVGFDQTLEKIGFNTGNLLFQHATWSALKNPKFAVNLHTDPAFIRANADVLFIPAANQINPDWDLQDWADFVDAVDLPVVVVGLGAQAKIDGDSKLTLQQGTKNYLATISERTSNIGVRGEFTAEVLDNLGIKNTVVTGCPSNFLNPNINGSSIGSKLSTACGGMLHKTCYVFGTMEPETRDAERILYAIANAENSDYVYQTNPEILRTLYNRHADQTSLDYFEWESSILDPSSSLPKYIKNILRKGRFYTSAAAWIDQASHYNLVYGLRIHGNIAAIQGGSLGICVAFDSRTLELATSMGYPYIHITDILSSTRFRLEELFSATHFSADYFDSQRLKLFEALIGIMDDAGISYHPAYRSNALSC